MEILLPLLKAAGALIIILAACELFTNGIEWFGSKRNLSKAAVGSVLAAVGTALPETLVPIVAIVFGGTQAANEIGIGAILGAPFMLATLAFVVTGLAAIAFARRRTNGLLLKVQTHTLRQDFGYFLVVYVLAVGCSPLLQAVSRQPGWGQTLETPARWLIAAILLGAYAWYVRGHFRQTDEEEEEELRALYFQRACDGLPRLRFIVSQVFVALIAIFAGAHIFVANLEHIAEATAVSPLVLSIIITPIATELPEKFNSLLWVRQGKDTLAIGNISGAMVFQSCIPVAVGVTLTDWRLDASALACAAIAWLSTAVVYGYMQVTGRLSGPALLVGLPFYLAFLYFAFAVK